MNGSERCEVLLIGGRSGAGKSTVSWEVELQLRHLDVAHCLIEGDVLDRVHPAPPDDPARTEVTRRNLAAIWSNYRALGHRRLVYCNTVSVLEPEMIMDAMGGEVRPIGVLLTAADSVAAQRLSGREIGSGLDAHIERSASAAAYLEERAPAWVHRVPTDGRAVTEIAEEIVGLTGWSAR